MFLLVACVTDDDPRNEEVSVGDPLPQFEIVLNNGSVVSTETLTGKVAMIIFFSTSCPDCQRELPLLEQVYRHFQNDGDVAIFAVSREEKQGAVEAFWEETGLTIPYSVQADRTVYNLFATIGVPRVYISDRAATIVAAYDDSTLPTPSNLITEIEYFADFGVSP